MHSFSNLIQMGCARVRRWAARPASLSAVELSLRLVPQPEDFSFEAWALALEHFESRAIRWVEMPLPPGYFGGCIVVAQEGEGYDGVRYPTTEFVISASGLAPALREHVRAHELAHIALGHPTVTLSEEQFANWAPDRAVPEHTPYFACRAADPRRASPRLARDQQAEELTRRIEQRVLLARQRVGLHQYSSQQDLDRGLERLGLE
jgi:hypothetical protein